MYLIGAATYYELCTYYYELCRIFFFFCNGSIKMLDNGQDVRLDTQ